MDRKGFYGKRFPIKSNKCSLREKKAFPDRSKEPGRYTYWLPGFEQFGSTGFTHKVNPIGNSAKLAKLLVIWPTWQGFGRKPILAKIDLGKTSFWTIDWYEENCFLTIRDRGIAWEGLTKIYNEKWAVRKGGKSDDFGLFGAE